MRRGISLFGLSARDLKSYAQYVDEPVRPIFSNSLRDFLKSKEFLEKKDIHEARKFIDSALSAADELSGVTPMIMGYVRELCKLDEQIDRDEKDERRLKK